MTSWWNKNAENRVNDFVIWVGESDQPSKIYCRGYIAGKQYKNIIDCGCGLASEYFGFKEDNYQIEYTGLDSCNYFIERNKKNGITMIEAELEENFPIQDNAYECSYCREVVEHLSYYEKTISEMIRISSKEVIIVWFIKPSDEEKINYWAEEDLYHNTYDKEKLEQFIIKNEKVDSIRWGFINDLSNRKDIIDELNKKDGYVTDGYITTEIVVETIINEAVVTETVEPTEPTEPTESAENISEENTNENTLIEPEKPWIKIPKNILHIILK